MKKGFATSAILYTMLLLFIILLVSILNNLQNKKIILDTLKKGTISALQQDTIMDSILDQITIINNKMVELNTKITNYENNIYTKTEVDSLNQTLLNQIKSIQGKYITYGYKEGNTYDYDLNGFCNYFVTVAQVGNGNISNPAMYLVVTGHKTDKKGAILKIAGSDSFNVSLDGFKLNIETSSPWSVITINKLC